MKLAIAIVAAITLSGCSALTMTAQERAEYRQQKLEAKAIARQQKLEYKLKVQKAKLEAKVAAQQALYDSIKKD